MPLNKEPAICYIPWQLASLRKTIFDFRSWLGDFYVLFPLAMLSQYIFGPLLFLRPFVDRFVCFDLLLVFAR